MEWAINSQVVNMLSCSYAKILCKIDYCEIVLHMLLSNALDPVWNCGGEKTDLKISGALCFTLLENFLNVFFKTKLEHDISFIKDDSFDIRKVDVSSFHVIKDTSSGSNEQISSRFQSISLVLDADSTIYGDDSELFHGVLQLRQLTCNLQSKFSSWSEHNGLKLSSLKVFVLSKIFDHWNTKGQSFSRTCQISSYDVFAIINRRNASLLDRKQTSVPLCLHDLDTFLWDHWKVDVVTYIWLSTFDS